ncbi:MAG: aminopeptidase, partial [Gemmatimonadetes bacterium]|nr:aminopeptidase [Gemmatimonadota bacterium]
MPIYEYRCTRCGTRFERWVRTEAPPRGLSFGRALVTAPRRAFRGALGGASLASTVLAACSPGYVARAAWEEARILTRRKPIAEVIADRRTDPELRGKLELVLEAREFARRELGLRPGRSYEHYTDVGRDTLALVLSASPPDRLVAKTWWFPIVGRVPYLGFVDARRAMREEKELKAQGFDTYLRPTAAFSTLGWLPDPLLSTALDDDSLGLAETVIHELVHNTVFVKSAVQFNESLANFVGLTGAAEFFCRSDTAAAACREAQARAHDAIFVSDMLDALRDSLVALYARRLPRPELLTERAGLLERMNERFREETVPRLRS